MSASFLTASHWLLVFPGDVGAAPIAALRSAMASGVQHSGANGLVGAAGEQSSADNANRNV